MFRLDVVSNTTPEVVQLLHSLCPVDATEECDRHGSNATTQQGCSFLLSPRGQGHVLLSSLPRVAALARRRALLLHDTTSTSAVPQSGTVVVRLVVSLLGAAATENGVPATITAATAATTTTTTAVIAAAAAAAGPSNTNNDAAQPTVPWSSAESLDDSTADVVYTGVCHHDENNEDDGVRFPFRLLLRTYPVAVFSASTVAAFAQHCRVSPSSQITSGNHTDEHHERAADDLAAPCLTAAMDEFHACVRDHELRSLHAIAEACDSLLCHLEHPTWLAQESVLEVLLHVPLYGVTLTVEDNQTTRLERVGQLTTPVLRAATGEGSPLQPLTMALQQLQAWRVTDVAASSSDTSTSPSSQQAVSLLLTTSRLCHLRAYVAPYVTCGLRSIALASPSHDLDVVKRCASDFLLPASLVHCQLGVSRSPSVVLLFYMNVFQAQWRSAAQHRTQTARQSCDGGAAMDPAVAVAPADIDPVEAAEIFHKLRSALVRARPRVKPNVCFAVQLLSLWKRCIVGGECQ